MSKRFRIFTALLLCLSIFASSIPAVFAQSATTQTYTYNGVTYTIDVKESKGAKVISVSGGGENTVVTVDTKTNKATVKTTGSTNINTTVDLATKGTSTVAPSLGVQSYYTSTLISSRYTTWWGYYYQIYAKSTGGYWWAICNGSASKLPNETSYNSNDLYGFKDAVDSCATNQIIASSMVGAGVAAAIAGALGAMETLTISAVIGLLIAFGASIGAAGYFYAAWVAASDADYHFARVY
jgi:hypothetical protein